MLIIKNGQLIYGSRRVNADILVEGDKITKIAPSIMIEEADVIDANGMLVFPGFIDAHTHFDMDNGKIRTADNFTSGTKAALVGGTTTIIDFATQDKGKTLMDAVKVWHDMSDGKSSCNYSYHMSITDWNEESCNEIDNMFEEGISSFKLYMAYDALRVSDDEIYQILLRVKELGGVVGVHCENGDVINYMVSAAKKQGHINPDTHPRTRPSEMEAEAISRLLWIAKLADCAVSIVHVSSLEGINVIREARDRGQKVWLETCPHYLILDDDNYSLDNNRGELYVCSPPLRNVIDIDALRGAVKSGEVDTISTDHCSYNMAQKSLGRGDYTKIPGGLPGVEHRPALVYTMFVANKCISPERMCELLSENQAKQFGMYPNKGCLEVGSDADIVIWNEEYDGIISATTQLQNVDYTPYEGMKISGRAEHVILNGEWAVMDGKLVREGLGRYVKRMRSC